MSTANFTKTPRPEHARTSHLTYDTIMLYTHGVDSGSLYRRTHSLSRLAWSRVMAPFYIRQMNRVNSPNGQVVLVFRYQMGWQYSYGNSPPLTGALNAGVVGRNHDPERVAGSMVCCEREVQYT